MNKKCLSIGISIVLLILLPQPVKSQQVDMSKSLRDLKNLLNDYSVRDDIELVDHQLDRLNPLIREMLISFSTLQQELHASDSAQQQEQVNEKLEAEYQKLKLELEEILLPHQFQRLTQIQFQRKIKPMRDTGFGILNLVEELELNEKQEAKIKEKIEENDEEFKQKILEMRNEIIELRQKMKQDVLDELSRDQREEYEKLVGREHFKPFWVTHWFTTNEEEKKLRDR